MVTARRTPYAEGSDWAAVELPYVGNALSMVLVLPAKGSLEAFEASLTGDKLLRDHRRSVRATWSR